MFRRGVRCRFSGASYCRNFLLGFVDAGDDSVGVGLSVMHGCATLLGMSVGLSSPVTAVEGCKLSFSVVACADAEELSCGEHGRCVMEVEQLRGKVAARSVKLKSA